MNQERLEASRFAPERGININRPKITGSGLWAGESASGSAPLTSYQLIIQEYSALAVFIVFATFVLGEGLRIRYSISFVQIPAALDVSFYEVTRTRRR